MMVMLEARLPGLEEMMMMTMLMTIMARAAADK